MHEAHEHAAQEKQIRARAGMRQLSERMRDRLKVNDRVSKQMLANVRLLPKVSVPRASAVTVENCMYSHQAFMKSWSALSPCYHDRSCQNGMASAGKMMIMNCP